MLSEPFREIHPLRAVHVLPSHVVTACIKCERGSCPEKGSGRMEETGQNGAYPRGPAGGFCPKLEPSSFLETWDPKTTG